MAAKFLKYLFVGVFCFVSGRALADTTWVAPGNISGNWTAPNSPYYLNGSVLVQTGDTLTIQAGVKVFFPDSFNFRVSGLLKVFGTEGDSVYFTTDTLLNTRGWRGLRFNMAHDSCRLEYTVIENSRSTGPADLRYGGGLELSGSDVRLNHCVIRHNVALIDGGGIYILNGSTPLFQDCEIHHNRNSVGQGGGVLVRSSHPVFENCLVYNNTCLQDGGGYYFRNGAYGDIRGGRIFSNSAVNGGGVGGLAVSTTIDIRDCRIDHNTATTSGGGIHSTANVILERSVVDSNSAIQGGGINVFQASAALRSSLIFGHTVSGIGGGVRFFGIGDFTLENSTVVSNSAQTGGGIYLFGVHNAVISNSIVSLNAGDGIHIENMSAFSDYSFSNFFGNSGGDLTGSVPEFVGVVDTVNFSSTSCDRFRNIFLDPLFTDPANGDFSLQDSSPCKSAASLPVASTDLTGEPRPNPVNSQPDMGALESEADGGYLYACGEIKGNYGPGNVIVDCDLILESEDTLIVQPGTTFQFAGRYEFLVTGLLIGIGTEEDSILFTNWFPDSARFWRGLRFANCHDSTQLDYFVVRQVLGENYSAPNGCGGMYIANASPVFRHGNIYENVATFKGGGVACFFGAEPLFDSCAIVANIVIGDEFQDGGGIYSKLSAPEFQNCLIGANSSNRGGGIFSDSSAVVINNCHIIENHADNGAGIYARGNGPRVTNSSIESNGAYEQGGGIYSHSTASFEDCILFNNVAAIEGGGLYSAWYGANFKRCVFLGNLSQGIAAVFVANSSPVFERCTFAANGGISSAIAFVNSSAVLNSSALWEYGDVLFFQGNNTSCEVKHCDILSSNGDEVSYFNNDSTQGPVNLLLISTLNIRGDSCDAYQNISVDPLFTSDGTFHLTANSPCIHAGDPELPQDPDGTIADIGAYYFHVIGTPPGEFDLLTPANNDTVDGEIQFCWEQSHDPDAGDPVTYVLRLATESAIYLINTSDTCVNIDLDGYPIPDSSEVIWYVLAQSHVPEAVVRSTSTRHFVKAPLISASDEQTELPQTFLLRGNYPNPFNASTTIAFELPHRALTTLSLYDVQGRLAATLAGGFYEAGVHHIYFDGSGFASGVYFVRMAAAEYSATAKMILLK